MHKIILPDGYVVFYFNNDVPIHIIDIIKSDNELALSVDLDRHDIYYEQLQGLNKNYKDAYFVAAFDINNVYMGGTLLFLDERPWYVNPDAPVFQGIARSMASNPDIKLNSLLIPAIISFIKDKGFKVLHVEPLDNQKAILLKHYNFIYQSFGELTYTI